MSNSEARGEALCYLSTGPSLIYRYKETLAFWLEFEIIAKRVRRLSRGGWRPAALGLTSTERAGRRQRLALSSSACRLQGHEGLFRSSW
ncbi:hypothetical protein CHELA1G11_14411 [Hyphomicrobiales bacterium]|nr:hypothetical protein CHELA1G11_14411 [Hyphomicrobiales bacterium]CAH1680375.1 hypothetical protein CHELA1G2_14693 [Hyphomicrobiales bacterium]